jgi:hypothetical protein
MNDAPTDIPYEGEIVTTKDARLPAAHHHNPFEQRVDERTHAGAVAIESQRATAEVQGRMVVAKRFPRSSTAAYARAMEACNRLGLAECAIYKFNRGGKVEGASIRLAEELARVWGNIEYGINELSRTPGSPGNPGTSEMEAFAWDLETNTRSSQRFTVAHIRDKTDGGAQLTTERDIYEVTANMGARRMRARILAVLPPELVDDAVEACKKTIKEGGRAPFSEKLRSMAMAFGAMGINSKMLEDYLKHPIDSTTPDELVDLRGVMQAIKDGAKVSEYFGAGERSGSRLDALEKAVSTGKPAPADTTAALAALIEKIANAESLDALNAIIADPVNGKLVRGLSEDQRKEVITATEATKMGFTGVPKTRHPMEDPDEVPFG